MKTNRPIIEFKNVSLTFDQKQIFDQFDMNIMPHEKVVVYGKSGIGKSTLLKLLLGFVQPDSGKIYLNNKLICEKYIDWVRTQIAYVDQDVIIGDGLVKKRIDEYFSFQINKSIHVARERIGSYLKDFGLEESVLEQQVEELSGGERQRVAIVIALLLNRPIMLLDEVTASLDPVSKNITIKKLLSHPDITLVVVTHDQEWKSQKETKLFDFMEKKWKR